MEQLIATHEVHGVEVDGKLAVIAPGKTFTPNSAKQRDTLLKAGAAKVAPKAETAADADNEPQGYKAMTVKQLQKHAADNNIDLGDAKLKDDIIAKIEAAEAGSEDLV